MSKEYGCLFCLTGHEQNVINYLERSYKGTKAISPVKLRYFRHGGVAQLEKVILFPGYVFFTADPDSFDSSLLITHSDIIKVLYTGGAGHWQLHGADRTFVEKLFEVDGVIGMSEAYYEGDRIHIESGFLKEYEGAIIGVNHRAKTAHIRTNVGGIVYDLWLGFEEISKPEKQKN